MKKTSKLTILLLISLLCLGVTTQLSQAATTGIWTYGESQYDGAIANMATMDGSHIVVGTTDSYGAVGDDLWMFKVATDGSMAWNKHYGGAGNESGFNVITTTDGGYAVVGATTSYGAGQEDLWLIKTDSDGNMQWNKTFGGIYDDEGWMLLQTSDGGYMIAGLTCPTEGMADAWLIKTDSSGNQLWQKTYGGSGDDGAYGLTKTTADGYILAGFTNSTGAGDYDVWLIRVDSSGVQQWAQTYGGTDSDFGYIAFETETDFVVDCTTHSFGAGKSDVWLLKVDAMGGLMWNYTYGGPETDNGWYGAKTTDGFALGGYTYSYSADVNNSAAWLIKVDINGMAMWNQTYGSAGKDYYGWAVTQTSEGGYAISGEVAPTDSEVSDAFLIVTDVNGVATTENAPNTAPIPVYILGVAIAVILALAIVAFVVLMRRKKKQPQPQP